VGAEAAEHLLQTLLRIQERRARAHTARQGEPVGEDSCDRRLGSGGAGPSGALHELCARRRRLGGRSPFRADARFDAECTQRTRIASNRSQSRPRGMAPLSRGHSRVLQLLDGWGPGDANNRGRRYQGTSCRRVNCLWINTVNKLFRPWLRGTTRTVFRVLVVPCASMFFVKTSGDFPHPLAAKLENSGIYR